MARPASFAVKISCPVNAHAATLMHQTGWDLFRDGGYIAGGVIHSVAMNAKVPRFASLEDARAWVEQDTPME